MLEQLDRNDAGQFPEGVQHRDVAASKIRNVPRHENESPDAGGCGQGHVVIVLPLCSNKPAPLRRDLAIDRDDAIALGLHQGVESMLCIQSLLRWPSGMLAGDAFLDLLDGQGADAQFGVINGRKPYTDILVAAGTHLTKNIRIEQVLHCSISRGPFADLAIGTSFKPISPTMRLKLRAG